MTPPAVLIEKRPDKFTVCVMGRKRWARVKTFGPEYEEPAQASWDFASRICDETGLKIWSDFGMGAEEYAWGAREVSL